ncbi:hypothetical protein DOTSEDRAFT_39664 [Dothistroma septosporum NZE10]|uniref:Uncharacterized protein n=1 Tax=Dothistroma septosporum (strain NZE10 / CBS 128990) TaxID=675120 RepID=M2XGD2_DOTSN|nr:hypothetical protein DOTSEDRAFT_39664 [Dothistroma septosporum NZE10]
MYTADGKIQLSMLQEDSEQILNIINQCVGHELREAGIHNITTINTADVQDEHNTAVAAINHHHDVLYQRGVNFGLERVDQLGGGEVRRFEIEGGADVLNRIVDLVEAFAKISLHKGTGLRCVAPPSNADVFGTSKKMEEAALIAALDDYWSVLRKKAWNMLGEENQDGGEMSGAGGSLGLVGDEERDPEDMTSSSDEEK